MALVWELQPCCIQETSCVWETGSVHPARSGLIKHRLKRSVSKNKVKTHTNSRQHPTKQPKQTAEHESIFCRSLGLLVGQSLSWRIFPSNGEGTSLAKLETLNWPKAQGSKSWPKLASPKFPTAKQVGRGL